MRRLIGGILALTFLLWAAPSFAQSPVFCYPGSGSISQSSPCQQSNPLYVTGTVSPTGTQDVNLTQVLGAAPSATNPIWVSPATASTPWAVSQATASNLNATVVGAGAAGTANAGVLTVQGIASMTPLLATLSGTNNINTVTAVTGITNTVNVAVIGNSFTNITTNTDTNVKGSAGTVVGFSINTVGTTSSVQIFNDADGTCSSDLIGTFATLVQGFVQVPAAATVGICVKTAGGVAADITVYWR